MKSLQKKLKELSIQCSLPAANSSSTKSTDSNSLQPPPQPLPNVLRGGPRSLLQGKPRMVASGKAYLPSPGGRSSSCSLGAGSKGCRGSMLIMSCLFKEWELRLWVMLVLRTDKPDRVGFHCKHQPSIPVGYAHPGWEMPLESQWAGLVKDSVTLKTHSPFYP